MYCAFKLLFPGTVNFSTSYRRWLIRQWFLISTLCLCVVQSLIFSPTKQPYWNVGNSRMYRYGNAVFTSNFYEKLNNKVVLSIARHKGILNSSVLGRTNALKIFHNICLGHPFSSYVSYDRFFNPLFQYASVHILDDPYSFPQLRTYLMDGLFLNQTTNKYIRISCSLNTNIYSNKKNFTKK